MVSGFSLLTPYVPVIRANWMRLAEKLFSKRTTKPAPFLPVLTWLEGPTAMRAQHPSPANEKRGAVIS